MIFVHAGPAEFDRFAANALKCREVKFLGTVIAVVGRRELARLETVGADDRSGTGVFDEEVVTAFVEFVGVPAFPGCRR